MADDIVTRLRESANYVRVDGNTWAADDCREAADEIERLRAENDGLRIRIYTLLKTLEQQAVRGE